MSKQTTILDEIDEYEVEFGFKERVFCTQEESKEYQKLLKKKEALPDGVLYEKSSNGDISFYRIKDNQVPEDKKAQLLMYQNAYNIRSMKKCISFITGLIVVGLIAAVIATIIILAK